MEHRLRIFQGCDLANGGSVNQRHQDCVSVAVDGRRSGKPVGVQPLHVGVFFACRYPGKVEPVVLRSSLQVVSIVLDSLERPPSEPSHLENKILAVVVFASEDVLSIETYLILFQCQLG